MDRFHNSAQQEEILFDLNWKVQIRLYASRSICPQKGRWPKPRTCYPNKVTWEQFLSSKGVTLEDSSIWCIQALMHRKAMCVRYGLQTMVAELLGNYKVLPGRRPYAVHLVKRTNSFCVIDPVTVTDFQQAEQAPHILPNVQDNQVTSGNQMLRTNGGTVYIKIGNTDNRRGILGQHNQTADPDTFNFLHLPEILPTPGYPTATIVNPQPIFQPVNFELPVVSVGYEEVWGYSSVWQNDIPLQYVYYGNDYPGGLGPVVAEEHVRTEPPTYTIQDENGPGPSQELQEPTIVEEMERERNSPLDLRLRSKRPPKGFFTMY